MDNPAPFGRLLKNGRTACRLIDHPEAKNTGASPRLTPLDQFGREYRIANPAPFGLLLKNGRTLCR